MMKSNRCLCGSTKVDYDATKLNWQGLCHCDSCRRTSGAPVVGWFGVANGAWAWAGAPPAVHHSSQDVTRYFCKTCGSPMAYASDRWPGEIHFTAATMDRPEEFDPQSHFYCDEHLGWLKISDSLEKFPQTAGN